MARLPTSSDGTRNIQRACDWRRSRVLGTVESRTVDAEFPANAKAPAMTTAYAFVVADVIKGRESGVPVGARIRVFREGGEMKRNGEVLRVINESLPELEPGEYVLVKTRNF